MTVSNIPEEQILYNILFSYSGLTKIIEYHKEHQLSYEIINFILSKADNSVLANLLFFQNLIMVKKTFLNAYNL